MAEHRILVSVVTFNNEATISRCLESVARQEPGALITTAVFDNASNDGTADAVARDFPGVELVRSRDNLGFGAAHNRVLTGSEADLAFLLNPDAWLEDGALEALVEALEQHPDLALVGPRVGYEDGRPQLSFGTFPGFFTDLRQRWLTRALQRGGATAATRLERRLGSFFEPDWVSGSCVLARRDRLAEVGFFDEAYFLYFEDVDLCRRLRDRGWRAGVEPRARCRHMEGYSRPDAVGQRDHFRRSRLIYENKFGSRTAFTLYRLLRARSCALRWNPGLVQRVD